MRVQWQLVLVVTLNIFLATHAAAAPFCAVFSFGRQCFYYDMDSCRQAAGTSGACVVNSEEVQMPSSGAPFCVVASFGTQCFYYDAQACREAAASSGGACVVNPAR
jgi:hypothetical protein